MQSYLEAVAVLESLQFKNTSKRTGGRAEKEASILSSKSLFWELLRKYDSKRSFTISLAIWRRWENVTGKLINVSCIKPGFVKCLDYIIFKVASSSFLTGGKKEC